MKNKSFWKQFAFELGCLFVWPAIMLSTIAAILWCVSNGYIMEFFAGGCVVIILGIVGSFVALAWERAENAGNMRDE